MSIIIFIVIIILLLIIDVPMITLINNSMYEAQFNDINNGKMKIGLHTWISSIVCYTLIAFGIYYFIINNDTLRSSSNLTILLNGALFGLVTYGIYNSTNKATINNYSTTVSIVDTLWGSILCSIISLLTMILIRNNIIS